MLYWPHDGSVLPFFWLPEEGLLDRDRKEGGHYRTWRDDGLLETTPGKAINFRAIIKRLAEIASTYDLVCVAYDRAFIKSFNSRCEEEGVTLAAQGVWPGLCLYERRRADCSKPQFSIAASIMPGIPYCAGRCRMSRSRRIRPPIASRARSGRPAISTVSLVC